MDLMKRFFYEEEGIATLEIVLIVVILLTLIIMFKGWIIDFFTSVMNKISGQGNSILE